MSNTNSNQLQSIDIQIENEKKPSVNRFQINYTVDIVSQQIERRLNYIRRNQNNVIRYKTVRINTLSTVVQFNILCNIIEIIT